MRRAVAYPLPTVWFAALVAITGLGLLAWPGRDWRALLVVEVVALVAFVVDAIACTPPSRIAVHREAPESVTVGDVASLAWVVENRSERAAVVTVADAIWPSLQPSRRRITERLAPRAKVRVRTELRPTRRGRFPLDAVTVRISGPLHLAAKQATRSLPATIRVMPAYPSRPEIERRLRRPRVLETGQRAIRVAGAGTEFDQLRDYGPDDEFRRIDWASTVRHQRPIVKQLRAERNQNVVLLLDNGRVMAGTVGAATRVEHAMDAALAMTQTASRIGDRVGLMTFDQQVRTIVVPNNSHSQIRRVAEAMFVLDAQLSESAYTAAFSAAAARFRRRSLYVVLTDIVEATVEQALLPALPIVTRRHLVVVAAVLDPAIRAWASGVAVEATVGPVDAARSIHRRWPSEAFREAAAIVASNRRARAVARLRAAGAIVVDAAPGRLAVELVDTYLALKAAGRL